MASAAGQLNSLQRRPPASSSSSGRTSSTCCSNSNSFSSRLSHTFGTLFVLLTFCVVLLMCGDVSVSVSVEVNNASANGNLTNLLSQSVTNDDDPSRSSGSVNYKHVRAHGHESSGDQNEDSSRVRVAAAPTPLLTDILIKASPPPSVSIKSPASDSSSRQPKSLSTLPSAPSSTLSTSSPSQITSTDARIASQRLTDSSESDSRQPQLDGKVPREVLGATEKIEHHNGNHGDDGRNKNDDNVLPANSSKSKRHALEGSCRKAVRRCFDQMPHSPLDVLPPTVQTLNNSCRTFEAGLDCFNNVSADCFHKEYRHHLLMNVHAEYEILKYVCYNDSFRVSCLSASTPAPASSHLAAISCYDEVASRWNTCANNVLDQAAQFHDGEEVDKLCCMQAVLNECVAGPSGSMIGDKSIGNGNRSTTTTVHLESMARIFMSSMLSESTTASVASAVEQCAHLRAVTCAKANTNAGIKGHPHDPHTHGHVSVSADAHLNDDTRSARAPSDKRNSMQDQYPFEYDDEYEDEEDAEDHDHDDDNDSHNHYDKGVGNGKQMTKLSSAKNAGGNDGKSTTTGGSKKKPSSKCTNALQKCINQIPPMPDAGIPSTVQGVKNACRAFRNGTECVNAVAKDCLTEGQRQQINNSILGAYETFAFLCNDESFRKAYLHHGECYNKISKHWDNCVKKFISALKLLKDVEKSMELCCLRIAFLHCVMDVTNRYCDQNATQFLRLLGETLIRTTLHGHTPKQCLTVKPEHCPMAQSSSGRPMGGGGGGFREGSRTHRFAWILGRIVLSLTMVDLVTFYYSRFIIT